MYNYYPVKSHVVNPAAITRNVKVLCQILRLLIAYYFTKGSPSGTSALAQNEPDVLLQQK